MDYRVVAEIFGTVLGVLVLLVGSWTFAMQWLLARTTATFRQEFKDLREALEGGLREGKKQLERLESRLAVVERELPREYVRREDWVRTIGSVNIKLDMINDKIGNLRVKVHDNSE